MHELIIATVLSVVLPQLWVKARSMTQLSNVEGVREALVVAGKEVKSAQEGIAGVEERAGQLLAAANILAELGH